MFIHKSMMTLTRFSQRVSPKNVLPSFRPGRAFHPTCTFGYPTGQHMAADGEELAKERDKHANGPNKQWTEKLATHSEAGIKAEKDTRGVKELREETVKSVKKTTVKKA